MQQREPFSHVMHNSVTFCSAIIRIKPRPLVLCCWSAVSPPFSFLLSTQLKGSHPVMADEVPGLKRDSTMAVTAQVICDNDLVS